MHKNKRQFELKNQHKYGVLIVNSYFSLSLSLSLLNLKHNIVYREIPRSWGVFRCDKRRSKVNKFQYLWLSLIVGGSGGGGGGGDIV